MADIRETSAEYVTGYRHGFNDAMDRFPQPEPKNGLGVAAFFILLLIGLYWGYALGTYEKRNGG